MPALPPNTYTVTGSSPMFGAGRFRCSAVRPVVVRPRPIASQGPPAAVVVVCPVK